MSMRPFTSTISITEARAIIEAGMPLIDRRERVSLDDARGRVLATDVVAAFDVPPFDRASMDGYAVLAADTTGASRDAARRLRLAGRVFTGDVPTVPVTPGACVEVATGAPMPSGADAVIMVEETAIDGADILVCSGVHPRQNIGPRGADITTGQTVLHAGDVLNASRIGALAALGFAEVEVLGAPDSGHPLDGQ